MLLGGWPAVVISRVLAFEKRYVCEVVIGPRLLRHAPGHSRGTDSRHKAALEGNGRTPRRGNLSSGGPARTPEDTRGDTIRTVRNREAPGSNPGPPTTSRIQSRRVTLYNK